MGCGVIIGILVFSFGAYHAWSHFRECSEGAGHLSSYGAVGIAAGLSLTLFCGYEVADGMALTAISAPMIMTYQRCSDLQKTEMDDLLRLGTAGADEAQLIADDKAVLECRQVMQAYAAGAITLLDHGHQR